MYKLLQDEYEVLDEYTLTDNPILMQPHKCGTKWYSKPKHFLNGSRCPYCCGNLRVSQQQFQDEVKI